MNYTHRKRAYHANAIQWKETNLGEVLDALRGAGLSAVWHAPNHVMIRDGSSIETIEPGYWVVRGENGQVKTYTDTVFKTKYEEVK
jgi:hypothetical protein